MFTISKPPPPSEESQILRRRIKRLLLLALMINLAGAISLFGLWIKPQPADCILVVASGGNLLDGESKFLQDRLSEAVRLFQAGWAGHIILSGDGISKEAANTLQQELNRQGIASEQISVLLKPRTTWESLTAGQALMREKGWKQAILVSNQYHMLRCWLLAKAAGLDASGSASHSQHGYSATALNTILEIPAILFSPLIR